VLRGHLDLIEDDEAVAGNSASTSQTYIFAGVKGLAWLTELLEYPFYLVL
jgi:hypothetical protein